MPSNIRIADSVNENDSPGKHDHASTSILGNTDGVGHGVFAEEVRDFPNAPAVEGTEVMDAFRGTPVHFLGNLDHQLFESL